MRPYAAMLVATLIAGGALAPEAMTLSPDGIHTALDERTLQALPEIEIDHWPTRVPAMAQ